MYSERAGMPGIPARSTPMFVWLDLYSNVDYPHPTGQRAFPCSDGRHCHSVPRLLSSPQWLWSQRLEGSHAVCKVGRILFRSNRERGIRRVGGNGDLRRQSGVSGKRQVQTPTNWKGVFPAATTQFTDDQRLDIEATARHLEVLIRAGVHGLIMLGTVGENCSLEYAEKLEVLRAAVQTVGSRVTVLVGGDQTRSEKAYRQLLRIGYDNVGGFLDERPQVGPEQRVQP